MMSRLLGFVFIPLMYASAIGLTYLILHFVKLPTYLPTIVWIMILIGIVEFMSPYNEAKATKKNISSDLLHILINPILMPVAVYLLLIPVLKLRPASPDLIQALPFWRQLMTVFLVTEFLRYWVHRWQHENKFLWKFHAVHHSMKNFYFLNQFISHPVDYFLRNVVTVYIVIIWGFSIEAVAYAQAISTVGGMVSHGNISIKNGFWNYIVPTYEVHRWHHSKIPGEANNNYGIGTQIWDHVFGTFYWPQDRKHTEMGIDDQDYQVHDFKGLMKVPFQK